MQIFWWSFFVITQDLLKHYLSYDPETGDFTWRNAVSKKTVVGRKAGYVEVEGYLVIGLLGKKYKAHRLAFLYMTGSFPENLVDHIDRNPLNNRWINLRDCDDYLNSQNQLKAHRNNSTGLLGVKRVGNGRYQACIVVEKKAIKSMPFNSAEEAHKAYLAMKVKHHKYCPDEIKLIA